MMAPEGRRALVPAFVVSVTVAACVASGATGSQGSGPSRPDLQRIVAELRDAGSPGVVMLVRNQSGTWRGAAGAAVLEPRRAMRATDRFRVASVTKTFVATVVLQLVGEGRLALDATVDAWLPWLRKGRSITVRQLLNHTSGFASFTESAEADRLYARYLENVRLDLPVRRAIAVADAQPLMFPPGTGQHYTNTGYDVLGLLVERVTREPLGRVLEERIFEPLRLRSTSFEPKPLAPRGVAHGYAIAGSDLQRASWEGPQDVTHASLFGTWASAAVVSSVDDLATFFGALFGGELLPRRLLTAMQRTVAMEDPRERGGLGVFRYRVPCGYGWGHGGATLGYTVHAFSSKDGSHVVVLAANAYTLEFNRALFLAAARAYCRS
jgi:D-alanyl-D-alanine carboxypeptidase